MALRNALRCWLRRRMDAVLSAPMNGGVRSAIETFQGLACPFRRLVASWLLGARLNAIGKPPDHCSHATHQLHGCRDSAIACEGRSFHQPTRMRDGRPALRARRRSVWLARRAGFWSRTFGVMPAQTAWNQGLFSLLPRSGCGSGRVASTAIGGRWRPDLGRCCRQ
jgi:hypothetical protein